MARYVFISAGYPEIIECEPDELWQKVMEVKYPKELTTVALLPEEEK